MRRLFFGLYGEKHLFRIIAVRFGGGYTVTILLETISI